MSEKRFSLELQNNDIFDKKTNTFYCDNESVCDLLNEQQDTIRRLQDLCGESDSENMKLRIENKKLKAKLREKEEELGGDY